MRKIILLGLGTLLLVGVVWVYIKQPVMRVNTDKDPYLALSPSELAKIDCNAEVGVIAFKGDDVPYHPKKRLCNSAKIGAGDYTACLNYGQYDYEKAGCLATGSIRSKQFLCYTLATGILAKKCANELLESAKMYNDDLSEIQGLEKYRETKIDILREGEKYFYKPNTMVRNGMLMRKQRTCTDETPPVCGAWEWVAEDDCNSNIHDNDEAYRTAKPLEIIKVYSCTKTVSEGVLVNYTRYLFP